MIEVIWMYRVHPEHLAEFERYYRDDGVWAELFRKATGYRGTTLLRDSDDRLRFATIDRWSSSAAYESFLREHQAEYKQIDVVCAGWTSEEVRVGCFEAAGAANRE